MKLITELNEEVNFLKENNSGKPEYFIEGIFIQGEKKNKNGRVYPIEILEKEVAKYCETLVKKNRAFGELGHPEGPTINLDKPAVSTRVDLAANEKVSREINFAISNSFGFGGTNASLLLAKV